MGRVDLRTASRRLPPSQPGINPVGRVMRGGSGSRDEAHRQPSPCCARRRLPAHRIQLHRLPVRVDDDGRAHRSYRPNKGDRMWNPLPMFDPVRSINARFLKTTAKSATEPGAWSASRFSLALVPETNTHTAPLSAGRRSCRTEPRDRHGQGPHGVVIRIALEPRSRLDRPR